MSESATFVNPVRQLPIWLFDLGRKSFFFGLPGHVRDIDSNQEDDCIPTVFALPRSAQVQPGQDNRHMSCTTNITSTTQPRFTIQTRSQSLVGPAYRQQQLTFQKQTRVPAGPALRKQYISLKTRTRVPVGPTRSPQVQQPTFRKLSRIPAQHSSLNGYASRYESWEHIAMGACTNRGEESMARRLTEWERYWKKISGTGGKRLHFVSLDIM